MDWLTDQCITIQWRCWFLLILFGMIWTFITGNINYSHDPGSSMTSWPSDGIWYIDTMWFILGIYCYCHLLLFVDCDPLIRWRYLFDILIYILLLFPLFPSYVREADPWLLCACALLFGVYLFLCRYYSQPTTWHWTIGYALIRGPTDYWRVFHLLFGDCYYQYYSCWYLIFIIPWHLFYDRTYSSGPVTLWPRWPFFHFGTIAWWDRYWYPNCDQLPVLMLFQFGILVIPTVDIVVWYWWLRTITFCYSHI